MMNNKFFEQLKEQIRPTLGEIGSHDFSHTERVCKYSLIISRGLNVDLDIVKAAAILHDIAKSKEEKREIKDHAEEGAIEARKILEQTNFPKEKIETVCKCISIHNKKEDLPDIKEARVLKEADGLEITGAIGIARGFASSGDKLPWNSSSPESTLNLIKRMARVDYYQLPGAIKLAEKRMKIMEKFYQAFVKEEAIVNK